MMIKAVLFDLDGTLADTALDLGAALNRLLIQHGLPKQPVSAIRAVASYGAAALIRLGRGIGVHDAGYDDWRQAFLDEYGRSVDQYTVLFEGVNELILALSGRQIQWGIVTNKPRRFTELLVPKLGFVQAPAVVVSGDTTDEYKPSPKPILYACAQLGVPAGQCLYVGDARRDIEAGRKAGMATVLAEWGYIAAGEPVALWGADYVIGQPAQLLDLL